MENLTSVRRLYVRFKSLVNDFVYSFGRAALLLLVEVYNHTVPVRERRMIRVNTGHESLSDVSECSRLTSAIISVHRPSLQRGTPCAARSVLSSKAKLIFKIPL